MSLAFSLAHLMSGILFLCAFLLLSQRRLTAMITLYRVQALTLAAAAIWQGHAQGEISLYLTGIITLALQFLLLPIVLRKLVRRLGLTTTADSAMPAALCMVLGAGLTGIAVLVVLPSTVNAASLTREDLAIALSVVLLGLLVMTTRRNVLARIIGFLCTENGLMLAAIGMPGMPFIAEFSLALLVLPACLLGGIYLLHSREDSAAPDVVGIADIGRRGG